MFDNIKINQDELDTIIAALYKEKNYIVAKKMTEAGAFFFLFPKYYQEENKEGLDWETIEKNIKAKSINSITDLFVDYIKALTKEDLSLMSNTRLKGYFLTAYNYFLKEIRKKYIEEDEMFMIDNVKILKDKLFKRFITVIEPKND